MPISERERREVLAANHAGNQPVVFIHGLWVLAEFAGRGHSLSFDSGRRDVADAVLAFLTNHEITPA